MEDEFPPIESAPGVKVLGGPSTEMINDGDGPAMTENPVKIGEMMAFLIFNNHLTQ